MNKKIEYKSFNVNIQEESEEGEIIAVVATESIDEVNDLLLIDGIKATYPMPLLLEHDNNRQLGYTNSGSIANINNIKCLVIKAKIDLIENNGTPFEIKYTTRKLAKEGKMQLSIGFTVNDYEMTTINNQKTRILKSINLKECSIVKNPANKETFFIEVKSEDSNDILLRDGLEKLKQYYDNKEKEKNDALLYIIENTLIKSEFESAIISYLRNDTRENIEQYKFILNKKDSFYKRCNEKKQKEIEANNEAIESKKVNTILDILSKK